MKHLATFVKERRKEVHLIQEEFAERAGVALTVVSKNGAGLIKNLPRIVVGLVFFSEGIQKYIMPGVAGAGRFERIGFEYFEFHPAEIANFAYCVLNIRKI
jgi:transcriptional regulator with XRE-family HTH domain